MLAAAQELAAQGACGGLGRILMPSAVNTASKGLSELPCTIPDQELDRSGALAEAHRKIARYLCRPRAVGVRGDAGQVSAAGAVLDDDKGIDAPQQHGVRVYEVGCEDAAGLRGQELPPLRHEVARGE